jgi:hypothetical protein
MANIVPHGDGLRVEPATGMVDAGRVCKMERVQDVRERNEGYREAVETTSGRKFRLSVARKVAPDSRGRPPRCLLPFVSAVALTSGAAPSCAIVGLVCAVAPLNMYHWADASRLLGK